MKPRAVTSSQEQAKLLYEFGPFRLITEERLLLRNGSRVHLTDKAFDLLVVLLEANGHLMETDALKRKVWDVFLDDATLPRYISMLRKALGDSSTQPHYIETVSKRGYRFKHEVRKFRWAVLILPFRSGGGSGGKRLGLGLASAAISSLGSMDIKDVVVRPPSAVIPYDTPDQHPMTAAREQNADYVLTGCFKRAGKQVSADVDFLRVYNKTKIWTKKYAAKDTPNRSMQQALADSIARDVALHFGKDTTARDETRAEGDYTTSTEAYQLYVDGRFHWNRFTRAGFKEAINCFRQAIAIDPKYAKAYAGIADCWIWIGIYSLLPPDKTFHRAQRWAEKALSIHPELSGAYTTLGFIEMFVRRNQFAAAGYFERAIELYENNIKAHLGYSLLHMGLKEPDHALTEINKALDIFSASLINKVTKAMILYQAGRNADALTQLNRAIKFDENFDAIYHLQSLVFAQEGDYKRAIKAARTAIKKSKNNLLNHLVLAYALAKKGAKSEARRIVERMESLEAKNWYVSPFYIATVYCALGEREQAYRRLEQARDRYDPWFIWLGTEPRLDLLRTDPHFAESYQVFKPLEA
jgi:DNA-binding winged helix-turn-helix (wHTH) protein/tetratricopeptide (TPR) repeat protein